MLGDRLPVLAAVLRERRRPLLLWSIAVAGVTAIYVGFWSAMGDGDEMTALIEGMPEGLVSALGYDAIGTPAGYLESTVFGLLGPVLLLVFAVGFGARLIGGEEEDGALELEYAHPIARRQVVLQRLLSLVVGTVVLAVVVAVVTLGLVAAQGMEVTASAVVATSTGLLLLVLAFGMIALAIGAALGRRGIALGVAAGVAVVTFIADAVASLVDWGGWLEAISPFSWYLGPDPLNTGWHLGSLAGLAALSVVAAVAAVVTFERRDLGV